MHFVTIFLRLGFEDEETERLEFQGETISSPVDGRPMLYFDSKHKFRNLFIAYVSISIFSHLNTVLMISIDVQAVLFCFVIILFAIVLCLALFQSYLNEPGVSKHLIVAGKNYSAYLTGVATIICIDVRNLFHDVGLKLIFYFVVDGSFILAGCCSIE
jgi:hypothetical protein